MAHLQHGLLNRVQIHFNALGVIPAFLWQCFLCVFTATNGRWHVFRKVKALRFRMALSIHEVCNTWIHNKSMKFCINLPLIFSTGHKGLAIVLVSHVKTNVIVYECGYLACAWNIDWCTCKRGCQIKKKRLLEWILRYLGQSKIVTCIPTHSYRKRNSWIISPESRSLRRIKTSSDSQHLQVASYAVVHTSRWDLCSISSTLIYLGMRW